MIAVKFLKSCKDGVVGLPYVLSIIGRKIVQGKLAKFPFLNRNMYLPHNLAYEIG
jgi:hypothetical protein